MFKIIPAHSLIISVGPNAASRTATVQSNFDAHEIISATDVCENLVGERNRPDLNSVVFAEIRHRIALKLSLGERVVVDAQNLRKEDRMSLARIGAETGVPVYYFVCDPEGADEVGMSRFLAAQGDLMRGDGLAEVIDWRHHTPQPIAKVAPGLDELRARFSGITVIADVHGMYQSLLSALSWARSRNHYVVLLGDVVDYGPDTLEVADEVYRLAMRGEGELILGNHERKISRWAAQVDQGRVSIRLSDGNRVTTNALQALGAPARKRWLGRFRGLVARASYFRHFENVVLAHAGVHPNHWTGQATLREIETWSLFGEWDPVNETTRPARRYSWTEAVPDGMTVIVGHDIRSTTLPLTTVSPLGGQTIFMDTGSGKGGFLSSVDLKFSDTGLRVANFGRY